MTTTTLVRSAPKVTCTVAEAGEAIDAYRGGFVDACGWRCGDDHPRRVLAAAKRTGDDVTIEIVRWGLRLGIA